ncbi:hypothetical protein C4D60_Mb06t16020 [Musa balbisiana]|uniref:Uncharacterized protein n=1 Tax=Musa balbisiana TaxID=52838 RepID=A0A4S8INC2_MUSBA|nr:hypothetical protein C4D60_Mb06t16020 [Musa balbisiana]
MSSGCKSSVSCVDARRPARPTYVNLYRWPESDAQFVKSMTGGRDERVGDDNLVDGRRRWSPSPRVVDSYSCRQMYLRSYTFSKEETATEKARQCLGKAKRRAAIIYLIPSYKFFQVKLVFQIDSQHKLPNLSDELGHDYDKRRKNSSIH